MESKTFQNCLHWLERGINRRTLLKAGLLTTLSISLPDLALAGIRAPEPPEKVLSLYNIHTGESIEKAVYMVEGQLVPETVQEINYLLRDFRNDQVVTMEPKLFDVLFALRRKLGSRAPFHVISGYRSPQTNDLLSREGSGVARNSLHMQGMAADVRLPGVELGTLRRAAMGLRRGGVGYYPASDFVHVDTGRVRSW